MRAAFTVYNRVVTPEEVAAAMARMDKGPFRCKDIVAAVSSAIPGAIRVPPGYTLRVADRLIQRARKAGRIQKGLLFGDWEPAKTGSRP